ncbi:MAG TPA: helix-turn-helix domain-containing protein [Sedimentisphaerales bacterium]|nr:helix-turn-helix domain-containing protein [Sedimentisphaerales bacterium]
MLNNDFSNQKISSEKQLCFNEVSATDERQIYSLLLSAPDAAKVLGIGSSHFWGLHSSGRLGPLPIKLGRRTLWSRRDLEKWTDAGCPSRKQWQDIIGNKD